MASIEKVVNGRREGKHDNCNNTHYKCEKKIIIIEEKLSLDLNVLNDEMSWKLFSQMAFEEGKEPNILELIVIRKEIVKKCVGIPLALKTIGNLLYTWDLYESDWLYFKDNELLKID